MKNLPDFCEIGIIPKDYFYFMIPVSAFGFSDSMILEISVEYWLSVDKTHFQCIVWARPNQVPMKHIVYAIDVPACDDPETGILQALNEAEEFSDNMRDFIFHSMEH